MAKDTDRIRDFATHLKSDGYSDEHVRMLRELADEVDRLRLILNPALACPPPGDIMVFE